MRRLAALLLLIVAVAACGGSDDEATTDDSTPPGASSDDVEIVPSSSSFTTLATSTTAPSTTEDGGGGAGGGAACTEEALLPVVKEALDRPPEIEVASVEVAECQAGYARVFATATAAGNETEQVFLRDDGGSWVVVDWGTGIDCGDPGSLTADDRAACEALGLTP